MQFFRYSHPIYIESASETDSCRMCPQLGEGSVVGEGVCLVTHFINICEISKCGELGCQLICAV